jgi:hypothetical protein
MPAVAGNLIINLGMNVGPLGAGFADAEAIVTRGTGRLGGLVDSFGRPVASSLRAVGDEAAATGQRFAGATEHFNLGGRSLSRFSAIAVQEAIPGLQGSRIAIEQTLMSAGRLAGSWGTLAIVGAGVAAVIGGILYTTLINSSGAAKIARDGVGDLSASITAFDENLKKNLSSLSTWNTVVRRLETVDVGQLMGGGRAGSDPASGGLGLLLTSFLEKFSRARRDAALKEIEASRFLADQLKGALLLEDPAAGPGGAIAKKMLEDEARAFFDLEKAVKSYQRSAAELAETDPLRKMLMADWQGTDDLIKKVQALVGVDKALLDDLTARIAATGGNRLAAISDQASKAGGPGAAADLGLGGNNILAGFRDVEKVSRDIGGFSSEMERLARAGVPVRDLFPAIAEAQGKLDEKFAALKERFADSPAVLAKVADLEKQFGGGRLQKGLDATVRSLGNVSQGMVTVEDEMGNLINVTFGVGNNLGAVADLLTDDIPPAARTAKDGFVTLTGTLNIFGLTVDEVRAKVWRLQQQLNAFYSYQGITAPGVGGTGS